MDNLSDSDDRGLMEQAFTAAITSEVDGVTTVRTDFVAPATNAVIVSGALAVMAGLHLDGGHGIKFTGPMSIPLAFVIAHLVAHRYGFVACFDPKLSKFVVVISHDPSVSVGDLMD